MSFIPEVKSVKSGRAYIGCSDNVQSIFAGEFCDHKTSGIKTISELNTKRHRDNVSSMSHFQHEATPTPQRVISEDCFVFAPAKCAPGETHSKQAREIRATVRPLGPHNLDESTPPVKKFMPRKTLALNRRNLGVTRASAQYKKSAPRKTLALCQRNLNTHQTFTHASF
eukprot:gene971-2594_t